MNNTLDKESWFTLEYSGFMVVYAEMSVTEPQPKASEGIRPKGYYKLVQVLRIFSLLVLGLVVLKDAGPVEAVTRQQIQIIQGKSVLSDKDLKMIDSYVQEQLDKMLMVEQESDLDVIRRDLLSSRSSRQPPAQAAFSARFAEAVKANHKRVYAKAEENYAKAEENYAKAEEDYAKAEELKEKRIARKVELSLAILLAETDRVSLISELVFLLGDKSAPVRYWAAKGLTMPTIQKHLLQANSNSQEVQSVVAGLSQALSAETHPLVIGQIAGAAALPPHDKAFGVLLDCVSKRQLQYQNWSVEKEYCDQTILNHLFKVAGSESLADQAEAQTALIRSAAGLLSVAYQRYKKGMQYKDEEGKSIVLYRKKRQRILQTLLIDAEIKLRQVCYRVDRNIRTKSRFQTALESGKWADIDKAYDYLLGKDGSVNRVFDLYPQGRANPFAEIPDPPTKLVDRAVKRAFIEQNKIDETM